MYPNVIDCMVNLNSHQHNYFYCHLYVYMYLLHTTIIHAIVYFYCSYSPMGMCMHVRTCMHACVCVHACCVI